MKTHSTTNTVRLSSDERITRATLERFIRIAKASVAEDATHCHGCGCTDCVIDMSHTISVKRCIEMGKAELAYDVENITPMCRNCHELWQDGISRDYLNNAYQLLTYYYEHTI